MALRNYTVEQGFQIDGFGHILSDSGAPLGTSGPTDDAPIGSLYMDTATTGELYHKKLSTSSSSDWERLVNESVYTLLGVAFNALDMGTFTGTTISDNVDVKVALQDLETALEAIQGGAGSTDAISAATPTVISKCLVDNCNGTEWEICAFETATEGNKAAFKVQALHDGTSTVDATDANTDYETSQIKEIGSGIAGLTFVPKVELTGASQTIGLEISATAAITVKTRRTDIP